MSELTAWTPPPGQKFQPGYLTFFGWQSFFFFDETTPQSLQRKSPGFAFRIGLPRWHDIANF